MSQEPGGNAGLLFCPSCTARSGPTILRSARGRRIHRTRPMRQARQRPTICTYGDGRHVRDWLSVEDHGVAIDRILGADVSGCTFNVGGRAEHENLQIIGQRCELIDSRFERDGSLRERFPECPAGRGSSCRELITHVRDRPGHDRRYAIETLRTGLARTVDWYLGNEPWWRGVMDGSYRGWIERQYGA